MRRQLEIIDNGFDAKVILDGDEVPGVREYSVRHANNEYVEIEVETFGGTFNFVGTVTQVKPEIKVLTRASVLDILQKHYWDTIETECVCACGTFRVHTRGDSSKRHLQDSLALHIARLLAGNGSERGEVGFEGELDELDEKLIGGH